MTPEQQTPDTILQRALDLEEPCERAAFLDEACGEDKALRKELDSLLDAHSAADSFMDTLVSPGWQEAVAHSGKEDQIVPPLEDLSTEFPELEIIELIGRGGMGAVFKARQASLDRFVALKVLPANWGTEGSFRERFEREAKTLAALNHPNIVTIHEFGERNGRFFFTMEFVDGTDLARMIKSGAMTPELALDLIPQVCEAIQFAHEHGVVHRDLKPGNILVGRDGRVKVADFGIAKLGATRDPAEESDGPTQNGDGLTAPRGVLGTPQYMAPEQAAGSENIDHRADLYALGVVFYEMLVGAPPEKGKLVPRSRRSGIDHRWDRFVLRALEEDPDRRYQNATEMKTAVQGVVAERKRGPWLAVAVLAIAVVTTFALWAPPSPEEEARLVNSLGMSFVPVPGVDGQVSIWETRVSDYETFVRETGHAWQRPQFSQTPEHPAVQVSWQDAQAFCRWLTERERKEGRLGPNEVYRLPSDREWSAMAHLPEEKGTTPKDRHLQQTSVYPWGEEGPIPDGAGNFPDLTGREQLGSATVNGFRDGYAATAPVGSFQPTAEGLHDLGGNVWEWTATIASPEDGNPVLRGGGWWAERADDGWKSLLASHRRMDLTPTDPEGWDVGFRVVRGPEPTDEKEDDLFHLIAKGDHTGVTRMVATEIQLNDPDRTGQPPIMLAADRGDLEMVKLLHKHGAKINGSDRLGRTALHAAANLGNAEMTKWLLANGADARARTITGKEPMFHAMTRAPIPVLELLLAAAGPESLTVRTADKMDPMVQACLLGTDETVEWLIAQLTPEEIHQATASQLSDWLGNLAGRKNPLMTAFLAKAREELSEEVMEHSLSFAICYDQEENFALLLERLGEERLQKEGVQDGMAMVGALLGRPWVPKMLAARGWSPRSLQEKNGHEGLLHLVLLTGDTVQALISSQLPTDDESALSKNLPRVLAKIPPPATRETIRVLAGAGAYLESRDNEERTPLIAAVMKNNMQAVETLLELGAELEARDNLGFTPLLCAVEKGYLPIVKELARRNADLTTTDNSGGGVLHHVHRHLEVLRYLLTKEPNLEARNKPGQTPLISLASEGCEPVISLLLEAGAKVDAVAKSTGDTALHQACRVPARPDAQARGIQASLGAPVTQPIPLASDEEKLQTVARLLKEEGADPMAWNHLMATPVHLAASNGLPNVLELLFESGAGANCVTKAMQTPLHFAAAAGQLEAIKVLLAHEAATDSPVFLVPLACTAVQSGNPDVLALLLEHGAPLHKRDLAGSFPLHIAAVQNEPEMLRLMLEAEAEPKADPNATDYQYRTPLHYAAIWNQTKMADLLWQHGARVNAIDLVNLTPADLAAQAGHRSMATHLKKLAQTSPPSLSPAPVKPLPKE